MYANQLPSENAFHSFADSRFCQTHPEGSSNDWRSDLLHAVHTVFAQEQEAVLAELRSQQSTTRDPSSRQTINDISRKVKLMVGTSLMTRI